MLPTYLSNTIRQKYSLPFLLLLLLFAGCKKHTTETCNENENLYNKATFPIGVAINPDLLYSDSQYNYIANHHFNSFTAENIFKPFYLHPEPETYYWDEADKLTNYCLSNNKRLHGHTLIWHNQLPAWITENTGTTADWEQLFKSHIQTIVAHFKGRIAAWDVVNEAFNEDGTLRNSIWRQKMGDTYIEKAFKYAHEADPKALLFYNDYNLEYNPKKRMAVINLLNSIRLRGVQVDGIGLQMHISIYAPGASEIAQSIFDVSEHGYRVHLSEVDISVNPQGKSIANLQSAYVLQADLMKKLIAHYQQLPAKHQYGITIWGISDKDSWIPYFYNREDYPLLFDNNYLPKPVYCALAASL
jgi:endo-1,4-beta-xylanase